MGLPDHVLAIDQGTSSTRAILFDGKARVVSKAQREHKQHYPARGWVEHDPAEIWQHTLAVAREALCGSGPGRVAAIGITNQRETAIVWDRATGEPVYRAIVWQDRRTTDECNGLKAAGAEELVRAHSGLVLDPYFSATKIAWILDNVAGARRRAERGELAFGTVDCFLLWRLTGGAVHATDPTNASRTMLFDIRRQSWDADLCRLFRVPESLLPEVCDNSHVFGTTNLFGETLPIAGMAGDQQAALFGQACFAPGAVKSTYGTGCFMLVNTGEEAVISNHRLLTTTAYRLEGRAVFALEGAIFVAGAAVKWLRDGLGVIADAAETDSMATRIPNNHGIYMVPAFVGLGAPYWDPDARASVQGLTLDATGAHLARAALEAVAYQTFDLMEAMANDGARPSAMRIDGGMAANGWLCQFLSDILDLPIERPRNLETTALGAAFLAGLATGLWNNLDSVASTWEQRDDFRPSMTASRRSQLVDGWKRAVARTLSS